MNSEEARAALSQVGDTENRLAGRMRWPFQRHAMFGLAEGLIVTGVGLPLSAGVAAMGAGVALAVSLTYQDKQRYGMFVSGWQGKSTRPLVALMMVVMVAGVIVNLLLRDADRTNPAVLGIGVLVAVFCTWCSLRWEKLYRAELRKGGKR